MSRRNITEDQRAYLIGKRYKEEKKAVGENKATDDVKFMKELSQRQLSNDERAYLVGKRYAEEKKDNCIKQLGNSYQPALGSKINVPTAKRIAEQTKVTEKTVRSAEKFADAVDKVSENTGINPQKILSGAINASRKDIQNVSRLEPELQKNEKRKHGRIKGN